MNPASGKAAIGRSAESTQKGARHEISLDPSVGTVGSAFHCEVRVNVGFARFAEDLEQVTGIAR